MNAKVFSPMNDIKANEFKIIKLSAFGQPKSGQYGDFYPDCMIEVDGVSENWQIPQKKKDEILKLGFKEGDTIKITRWFKNGKGGYNFESPDAKNPYFQPAQTPKAPVQNDYGTQAGRGACWNVAAQYVLKLQTGSKTFEEIAEEINKTAEKLVPYQSKFVNKP